MKKIKVKGEDLQNSIPKDPMPASPMDQSDPNREPSDWETKDHLKTLMDAHEIMNNPVKIKAVHKLAGRHANAIKGIQDIKDHYNQTYGGKNASLSQLGQGSGDGESGE